MRWDFDFFGKGLALTDIRSHGKINCSGKYFNRKGDLQNRLIINGKRVKSWHPILAVSFEIPYYMFDLFHEGMLKPRACLDSDTKIYTSSSEGLVPRFLQILEKYLFIRLLMFDTIIALRTTVQITGCWVIWPVFIFTVSLVALFYFLKAHHWSIWTHLLNIS